MYLLHLLLAVYQFKDEVSDDIEEPEEVKQAWDELQLVQREQQRYSDIKLDLYQDLEDYKHRQKHLEDVSLLVYQSARTYHLE